MTVAISILSRGELAIRRFFLFPDRRSVYRSKRLSKVGSPFCYRPLRSLSLSLSLSGRRRRQTCHGQHNTARRAFLRFETKRRMGLEAAGEGGGERSSEKGFAKREFA